MVDGNPAVTTETKSTVLSRVRVWHTWCTHLTTLANLYRTQVKYIGHHGKYMIYRTHVCFIIQCVYQCNVQCLVSDIIMNIQTVSRPLLTRLADGHWHSYELLDIAVVNDLVIWCCKVQRSMLVPVCIEFLSFCKEYLMPVCREFSNPIANGKSFNIQSGVCVRREFSGEGICLKEISPRNVWGTRHPGEIAPGEKCLDTYAGSQVDTCSGYDVATMVNTYTHTQTDSQTGWQTDILWPVILLAQPADKEWMCYVDDFITMCMTLCYINSS